MEQVIDLLEDEFNMQDEYINRLFVTGEMPNEDDYEYRNQLEKAIRILKVAGK